MADIYIDGDYTRPEPVGFERWRFDFRTFGDRSLSVFEQEFWQRKTHYTPQELSVPHPEKTGFYLVGELPPRDAPGVMVSLERMYARLPGNQVWYEKPTIPKPDAGAAGGVQNVSPWVNVYFYDSINTSVQVGLPIYYRDYFFINNEVFGPIVTTTSANSGGNTRVTFSSAHGVAGTERISAGSPNVVGAWYTFDAGEYTVVDPTTIDLLSVNYGANIIRFARKHRDYTPGSLRVSARMTQSFYLAGVSPGITNDNDIPTPVERLNDALFIDAVIDNVSGWVDYSATDLGRWPSEQSPIRTVTTTAIDFSDL